MQTLSKKTVACLVSLTMALALFGIVSMPKKAWADNTLDTVTINFPTSMQGDTVNLIAAAVDGTTLGATTGWATGQGSGGAQDKVTITLPSSGTTASMSYTPYTADAAIVFSATDTTNANIGAQSAFAKSGASATTLTFTDYDSSQAEGYPNDPSSSTTVTANVQGQLTLEGGDSTVDFGTNPTASPATVPTSPTTKPMYVTSNTGIGYKLQAFASTTAGSMNLDGNSAASTAGVNGIPWGKVVSGSSQMSSAWNVVFSATQGNAAGDAEGTIATEFGAATGAKDSSPFTGAAGASSGAIPVAELTTSTNSGNTAIGGDELTPTYNIALFNGLDQGTYATTITYTLSADTLRSAQA
ncbi:MAG: hypothetical protein LBL67_04600 [Coriobacteriales bacterium]|jgi:hypothetical protein|nr:hypothetical protein [Coriobacteriales bacterium]